MYFNLKVGVAAVKQPLFPLLDHFLVLAMTLVDPFEFLLTIVAFLA
jgi:hypothetical protein